MRCALKPNMLYLALIAATAGVAPEQVSASSLAEAEAVAEDAGKPAAKVRDLEGVQVVSSTHRIQSIQEVPLSISAIGEEKLRGNNLSDITQIQYLVPGISFSTDVASRSGGAQIRGIGTQSFNYATEQTVGTVVDDVILGLPRDPGVSGFNDIERIEVLRGPQGTLFGKNASAGVISIITRNPEIGRNSTDLHLAMGSRNEHVAQVTGNFAVSDTSALRISGYLQEQDGAVPSVFHSWHAGDRRYNGIRGKYLWEPNERLSVVLGAEHQNTHTRQPYLIYSLGNSAAYNSAFDGFQNVGGDNLRSYTDQDWTAWTRLSGTSLKIDYTLDNGGNFTSVSAFRKLDMTQIQDTDLAPSNLINNSETYNRSKQLSQEFRLVGSSADQRLDYTLGAFLMRSDIDADEVKFGAYSYVPGAVPKAIYNFSGNGINHFQVRNRNYALFGSTTYALTDRLSGIAGARYTYDQVSGDFSLRPFTEYAGLPVIPLSVLTPSSGSVSKGNVSGKLGLQYQQNEEAMYYATISQGYKGPAVDVLSGSSNRIKPETSINYELGWKSRWFDRRLTVNGSVYWDEFRDFQATALDMATLKVTLANAPRMRTRGLELETSWLATDNLTLSANGSITDARFLSYIGNCPQPSSVPCHLQGGVSLADFSGQRPAWYSKYNLALSANYQHPIGDKLLLDGSGSWSWRSSYYSTVGQAQSQTGGYGVVGANIGLGAYDGRWRVSLYARNLLDKRFRSYYSYSATINPGGYIQMLTPDSFRTVGVAFDWHF